MVFAPRPAVLLLVLFLSVVAGAASAHAETPKRFALVIGNSAYRHVPPLPNSARNASDIAEALVNLGFEVTKGLDLERAQLERLISAFRATAAGAESVVLYYAGHGFQLDGINHLVPVDAALRDRSRVDAETLLLGEVIRQIHGPDRQTIVFLEASHDSPLPPGLQDTSGPGLAAIQPGLGLDIHVAFAAKPGSISLDGPGRNSTFTKALLKHMTSPRQTISTLMIDVRNEVLTVTGGAQNPWEQSSLTSEFSFAEAKSALDPWPGGAGGQSGGLSVRGVPSLLLPDVAARLPEFPWPPPVASAHYTVPNSLVAPSGEPSLTAIATRVEGALDRAAYYERSYFGVPGGFALVTRLERVREDGRPDPEQRWKAVEREEFSLLSYIRKLLFAPAGRYRLIVFVVTPHSFALSEDQELSAAQAEALIREGHLRLPAQFDEVHYTSRHRTTALVYEFEKGGEDEIARLVLPSELQGRDHLERAKIWAALASGPLQQLP